MDKPMSTTGHHWWERERRRTTAVQDGANLVSWLFLIIGVLGFIPLVTTGFSDIAFAGHASGAALFGVFAVSVLHNLVHLATGVVGHIMSWFAKFARSFLIGGGVLYLALGVYGFFFEGADAGNFLPSNWADDWLHVGLGVLMVLLGLVLSNELPPESEARGEGDFGETNRGAAR